MAAGHAAPSPSAPGLACLLPYPTDKASHPEAPASPAGARGRASGRRETFNSIRYLVTAKTELQASRIRKTPNGLWAGAERRAGAAGSRPRPPVAWPGVGGNVRILA